jgi:hypothetical protein
VRLAAILLALSAGAALSAGCSLSSPDSRAVRHAVGRYLAALTSHDAPALRDIATCALSDAAVRGASLLRLGPIRSVPIRALDSLSSAAEEEARASGAAWARAVEENADSLWLRARALERRAVLYRNALAAARRSAAGAAAASVRVCRVRVRIRWGGPLVGPEPVDREHLVRALAAPGGRWFVFSSFPREDDPPSVPL